MCEPPATMVENAGKAELRQRSWATPDDVIPSRLQKFMEIRTGTEERRRRPPSHQMGKWRSFLLSFILWLVEAVD